MTVAGRSPVEVSIAAVEVLIVGGTPESRLMGERIEAAIARCERLNKIPYSDSNAIRAAWSELTGLPSAKTSASPRRSASMIG